MDRQNVGESDVFSHWDRVVDEIEVDVVRDILWLERLNFDDHVIVLFEHGTVVVLNIRLATRQTQHGRLNEDFRGHGTGLTG